MKLHSAKRKKLKIIHKWLLEIHLNRTIAQKAAMLMNKDLLPKHTRFLRMSKLQLEEHFKRQYELTNREIESEIELL